MNVTNDVSKSNRNVDPKGRWPEHQGIASEAAAWATSPPQQLCPVVQGKAATPVPLPMQPSPGLQSSCQILIYFTTAHYLIPTLIRVQTHKNLTTKAFKMFIRIK